MKLLQICGDDPLSSRVRRVWTLGQKEVRQIIRDPSSIALGVVFPTILILLFGFGLSLDAKHVPVGVVLEDPSPDATELASTFQLSRYFDVRLVGSMFAVQKLMLIHQIDGIVWIPMDFSRRLRAGGAEVQIVLNGQDANRARIVQGYAQGAVAQWTKRRLGEGADAFDGPVMLQDRMWFNEADDSHYFLVPGLIVLVITLNGALLTTLVVAREWERGTFEALFATPVRSDEILLSKVIPYFGLGAFGLTLCLLAAKFLFHLPFRGSLWVLAAGSILYILVALGIGLLISATVKVQFLASQITLAVAFVPVVLLSGFIYDLNSLPAAMRFVTYIFPARYYTSLLQTVLLAGDFWPVILQNAAVLAGMATLLLLMARRALTKQLD
jgi:pyoluteorin transport system permease protein